MNLRLRFAFLLVVVLTVYFLVKLPFPVGYPYDAGYFVRFYLPKLLPFAMFAIYLCNNPKNTLIGNLWSIGLPALALGSSCVFAVACILQVPVSTFLGIYQWSYAALIEWSLAFVGLFAVSLWKTRSRIFSVTFATLAVSAGGMLYELILYPTMPHLQVYFHSSYPLFIATKWFSLLFLGYLLYQFKWKLNLEFFLGAWFFVLWSILYALAPHSFIVWLPRLPAIIMLATLPFGLRRGWGRNR